MRCPACKKKVVFGSVVGDAWAKLSSGEWLLGGRPPSPGKLGDCPACGLRLEWEPGEELIHDPARAIATRVHLSALREAPEKLDGKEIWMRALVVETKDGAFLSDSWRHRRKDGVAETDAALLERLAREQLPRIAARFATPEIRARVHESSQPLSIEGAFAAWVEAEGRFHAGTFEIALVTSVWPPA